jgi:large repetitive protein
LTSGIAASSVPKLRIASAVVAVLLTACGRVPLAAAPSPSAQATPTVDSTPVAGETPTTLPTVSAAPTSSPRTSPRSTPSTSRPSPRPSPTFAPLVVNAPAFHAGEVQIAYAGVSYGATGGKTPYTWSVSGGALPDGMSLSSAGTVAGTPTLAGSFTFTALVTDARGFKASKAGSITIAYLLSAAGRCDVSPCSVEAGCTTVCGSLGSESGGVAPFAYTAQGSLPPGMGLNGLALTGAFQAGSYKFGVTITDALGAATSVAAAFDVYAHISLTGGSCTQKAGSGLTCQIRMPYSGGTGKPAGVALNPKTPGPKGTTVSLSAGVVLVTVPAQDLATGRKVQVIITDSAVCGPSVGQRCTATATATYSFA